jgi:hypothetical protein
MATCSILEKQCYNVVYARRVGRKIPGADVLSTSHNAGTSSLLRIAGPIQGQRVMSLVPSTDRSNPRAHLGQHIRPSIIPPGARVDSRGSRDCSFFLVFEYAICAKFLVHSPQAFPAIIVGPGKRD